MRTLTYHKKQRMLSNLMIIYFFIFTAFMMSYFLTYPHLKTAIFYCTVVLLAVTFASFAEHTKNPVLFHFFVFLSFFSLFFTFGFRNFSAIDDSSYIGIFNGVSAIGWLEYFKLSTIEPGYLILNHFVAYFTENYIYMQLISSFIPLAVFYYGFVKHKDYISLPYSVFLLCSMLYFQMLAVALVRMFIAISIIFVALWCLPKYQPFRYILLVLLATSFHYSAFFMIILVYFAINKKNLSKKTSRFYTILFLLTPVFFIFISRFVVPLLGNRYQRYGTIKEITLQPSMFTTLPLILLLLLYYKKFKPKEQQYFKLFLFVYSLSIIISIFGGMVGLGRLIFYSYAAFVAAVAMVIKFIRFQTSKFIFSFIIIFYGFLYVFYTQFTNISHIDHLFPYNNIFFNV